MVVSIQYMRAFAALLVVVHHAAWKGEQYSSDPFGWFRIGGSGVDLFFIISGYIMCHTSSSRHIRPLEFIKARIERIIPIYWLLTTVALGVYIVMPERINSSGGSTTILHSYTLLPSASKYLVQNGWTLTYEFFFYAIFALGLTTPGKVRFAIPCSILLALVATGAFLHPSGTVAQFATNPLLLNFVMGIYAFILLRRVRAGRVLSLALIAAALALLASVNFTGGSAIRIIDYAVPCLLFFIGMVSLEDFFVRKQENLVAHTAKNIGDSSYSLYLIHPFVLVPAAILLKKVGLNAFGNLFVVLLVILSAVAGWYCYRWLEKPVTRMIRKH